MLTLDHTYSGGIHLAPDDISRSAEHTNGAFVDLCNSPGAGFLGEFCREWL